MLGEVQCILYLYTSKNCGRRGKERMRRRRGSKSFFNNKKAMLTYLEIW